MSPEVARTGPIAPVWRSPLIGADRKSPAEGQTGAIDPERTSSDRRQELVYRQDMFLTVRIPTF
jgi:hypothetical protein